MRLDDSNDGESGKPRVLFIDDEPLVIRSLRRTLAGREVPWEFQFTESGEAALELLAQQPFDVVVSDLLMPGMSGAMLLERVQEAYPDVARVVLSGLTDPSLEFQTIPFAHAALAKPFETPALLEAISRAIDLRTLLVRPDIRAALGAARELPLAPPTYIAISRALAQDRTSVADLMAILEGDAALSARLARLASYAPEAPDRPRPRLSSYVARSDPGALRALVLLAELEGFVDEERAAGHPDAPFSLAVFGHHAVGTAHLAARIVGRREDEERAFVAGLVHDVGELLLAARKPEEWASAREQSHARCTLVTDAERTTLGVSHAEVGAWFLGVCGFPLSTIDVVLAHHEPADRGGSAADGATASADHAGAGLSTRRAVHVASILARDPEAEISSGVSGVSDDAARLARRARHAFRLEQWRQAARELSRAANE